MKNTKSSPALDLTQGDPLRQLVFFALPMLVGAVFQLMYNMVDTVTLGKFVSTSALASVGATSSTYSLFTMVANAVTNAVSILVSQSWGARNIAKIKKTVAHSIYLALALSAVLGLLAFFAARPLMELLDTPADIIDGSVTYIRITCGLCVSVMLYNVSSSILRSIGDSRTPLFFLILCSLLNIALDLLFVLALDAGVAGVAWATVISQAVSSVLCLGYMWLRYPDLRVSSSDFRPDGKLLGSFARISTPMLLQSLALSVGMLVITRVINSLGSDTVASFTIGSKVEQLVVVAFSQFAFSFSVFSGQNYGAKKYDRIGYGLKRAALLILCLVAVAMTVMLVFAPPLANIFVDADESPLAVSGAVDMVRTEACFLPALGLIWLSSSCLRGMGKVAPTVVSSMVELISKIALSIVLAYFFGARGVWFAAPIGWVLGIVPNALYYFFSGWKKKALEADAQEAAAQPAT